MARGSASRSGTTILQQPPRTGDGPSEPGWYECGLLEQRYWDGTAWTDEIRSAEPQVVANGKPRASDALMGPGQLPTATAPRTGLRVITGRPAALRTALAERVTELRGQDALAPISILVGTSLQRPHLSRWLAARLGGHANLRILMPGDLALLLGAPALVQSGRRALPPLADRILLAEVAGRDQGYFAPVAKTPGFAEALYRLVRELKGAGYDVGDLGALLDGTTDAPEKGSALAEILAAFEARRRDFYGPDDALLAADPARLDGLGLLVTGMLELPPALERVLNGIALRMPVDLFSPAIPAAIDTPLDRLRAKFAAHGVEERTAPTHAAPASALDRVRARLFTAPTGAIEGDETLRLVSAPDPSREVRAAARAFLEWAGSGTPFWDMAIVYRHGDEYRPLVEAVLAEADIPVYLHEGSPLTERPLGRQTLGLLALYDSDLSRQSVMDFLTDARFPAELRQEFDGVPATRWDSLSRDAGVISGLEQWRQRLASYASGLSAEEDPPQWITARLADTRTLTVFLEDLAARMGDHPARAAWSEHLDFLQELLSRYVRGATEVLDALRGLERFTALQAEVGFERFLEVVRRAIGTLRSEDVLAGRPGAFARRGVNVVAVNSMRGLSFARVWILGATERSFPPPPRQDPILLDVERAAISARAPNPLVGRADRGNEEALVFALACDCASASLAVSYARRATGESRPRLPSIFFREIASQLVGERVSAEDAPMLQRADVERIAGDAIGAPGVGEAAAATAISAVERDRTFLQAPATQPLAIAALEGVAPAFARARDARAARFSGDLTPWDGALGPEAAAAAAQLLANRPFSPSGLESYAKCPQQFLMGSVLRVRAIEEPERTMRIDALRRGTLFHRILERFHAEWTGAEPAALSAGATERMRGIAGQECEAAQLRGETGYPAMWAADRLEVIDDCLRWLEVERADPWTRALSLGACEARFGMRFAGEAAGELSRDDPIELMLGRHRLRLNGRIDRITWDPGRSRFRVVDYKTGKVRDEKPGRLQGGRMLQLPLYTLAGGELLGIDPRAGEAAYVYPTRRGGFTTIAWSAGDLAERYDEVIGLLDAMLDAIASGTFILAPRDESECRWCAFDSVCPTSRQAYVKRKADDERRISFETEIRSAE
jgi:ATP-dependent helicase/nuclease subunit B